MRQYPEDLDGPERDETAAERMDRNWTELLQELRVTQTGIQILSGFLLILPFQALFDRLTPGLTVVYLLAVLFGTLTTGLMVAPVTAHRLFFRQHVKDRLVALGDTLAKVGLICFAVTVGLVITLVMGITLGIVAGAVAGVGAVLIFAFLWIVLPLAVVRRQDRDER